MHKRQAAGTALLGLTATELPLSVTLLAQYEQPTGQQQSSSRGRRHPGEAVREGRSRPGALEAEQGGRVPVTNEDLLKVTLASVGSMMHTRVYKFPQLRRGKYQTTWLPALPASIHSPVPVPACQP